ncbi:MAG: putative Spermine/spermidine synthase family protein [Gammaproteobacteria bacterium]|nr:putative Spermine/spermidine synthase family protein [Gammaproteobacteria bacterium]
MLIWIVAASGFAGLGYEMVWTRLLSTALGSEMMAVLGAVAGLFAGLSLGAFLLDEPIRRVRSPQIAYAVLETVIGIWGVVSIWLLPAASRIMAPLLGAQPTPTLHWTVSFALPAVILLPATTAMGGTLAALERMTAAAGDNGRVSAGVYGANTAGAVAGTLITAFVLFHAFGLSGTLLCLAGVNFTCAAGALMLRSAAARVPDPRETNAAALPGAVDGLRPRSGGEPRLTLTLFFAGLLGISFEVLVVRLAAQTMQDTIYTFAGLLAAYLLGTALGGVLWQKAGRKVRNSTLSCLVSITALACLATAAVAQFISSIAAAALDLGVAGELVVALSLFLLPSAAMGALFGYLAQCVRDQRGSIGRAVGINSLGAALAPLLAAQILIPTFGAWTALLAVALGYLLLLPLSRAALVWAAAPAIAGLTLAVRPPPSFIRVPNGGELLAKREGPMVTASVVSDASGARYLEVNGHFRMGGTTSMRSDYRQAMLPLLLHPQPHRALFLGVGTGATLIGAAQMPRTIVRGVELSPEVVALLPWFSSASDSAASDAVSLPPVTIADARRYVAADTSQYDVIVADLFHPALDGSGALYTTEHFLAVRNRLARAGLFCQWLPLYQLDLPSLRAIIRGFLDVYPDGSAWLNHFSVRTPMLALIGRREGGHLDLHELAERLSDPAVGAVVRPIGFEGPMDVLGQYVGGSRTLAAFAGQAPRNTDDFPFVALDAQRNVRALAAPPSALLLTVVRELRPDSAELLQNPDRAFIDSRQDTMATRLAAYWQARDRFLEAGAALTGEPRGLALVHAAAPALLEAIRISPEFDPAYNPLMGMARALLASNRAAAEYLLHEIDNAAPSRKEARGLLSEQFGE